MKEFELKYGCNPNQKPARIYMADGSELPVQILCGRPGYINFLDAFNGWQLVRDLKEATGFPAATSFKHVSPAGASIGLPLTETLAKIYWVDDMDWQHFSPLACAYARARGADRMSSFGDFISLSDVCDKDTALLIKREVSDGVIAPGYTEEALEILKQKKKGSYNIIQIDPDFVPAPLEHKEVFGVTFEQGRQELPINDELISFCHDVNETLDFSGDTYLRDILYAMNERREQLAIIISAGMENRLLDSLNSLFREEDLKYRVGYYIWTGIIYNIAMEWEKGNLGNDLDKIIEIVYHATKPMAEQLPGSIRDL